MSLSPSSKAIVTAIEIDGAQQTDRECWVCEEGTFLQDGHEMVCSHCGFAPEPDVPQARTDPWEQFEKERHNYAGFKGPGRVRMVGGFPSAYYGDGIYGDD